MPDQTERTIALAQFEERLRQERETFDRKMDKDRRSFRLGMAMGWIACALLPTIAAACFAVLYWHDQFTDATVTACAGALIAEVVGCVVAVWRAFAANTPEVLAPVSPVNPPHLGGLDQPITTP